MAKSFISEYSADSLSLLYSEVSELATEDEEEACPKLLITSAHNEGIHNFTKVNQNETFDLHPSWSGMNIKTVTNNKVDMRILAQRVIYLLENVAHQTRVMGSMPILLENNGKRLRKWMNDRDVDYIIRCVSKQERHSQDLEDSDSNVWLNGCLRHAFGLLAMNKCVSMYVERHPPQLTHYSQTFLNALSEFSIYVRQQMELTWEDQVNKISRLHTMFEVIRDRRLELKRLAKIVNTNFAKYDKKTEKKAKQVAEMEKQLNGILEHFNQLKQDCLFASEKSLYQADVESTEIQAELAEEAKESHLNYAAALDAHLSDERIMRARKIKNEAQLSMWLTKFDNDVGEKQRILEEMSDEYERDNMELQELKCLMAEQAIVYARYQEEEQDKLLTEIKDKLFAIASKRAARILQKYWRAYLQRKRARKGKKKKGKGKKK